ncbi:HU family DNA-binding protein [Caballeronia sp. CLC5]
MNKQELIDAVASQSGISKTAAEEAINAVFECLRRPKIEPLVGIAPTEK